MEFSRPDADIYVPAGLDPASALLRVTHLGIGAHQDDLEIMAHSAICACLDQPDTRGFGGVVVTDGGGSARTGPYATKTDEEMKAIRREEQRRAAEIGRYTIQIQLAHPSAAVKAAGGTVVVDDLGLILVGCTPREVIVHNPTDKHDTHVAVLLRSLVALRAMEPARRPARLLGVEVWRGLDWMLDGDKVALDDSARPELRARLLEVFDSQIFGGKRYDLATEGRRFANATFHQSHERDALNAVTWAMDLTPLLQTPTLDVTDFALSYLERLQHEVAGRIRRLS